MISALLAFKALHLIAMVAWFVGLFYLFRLFVYHAENHHSPHTCQTLTIMAEKLSRIIMGPARLVTWGAGLAMLWLQPGYLQQGWLQAKLAIVLALSGYHDYSQKIRKRFAAGDVCLSSRQCRWLNEVPTLALIAIVVLAVFRPRLWT